MNWNILNYNSTLPSISKYLQYPERIHVDPAKWATRTAARKDQRQGSDKIITAYFWNCMHNILFSYDSNLTSITTTQRRYSHVQLFRNISQNLLWNFTYARISCSERGQFTILKKNVPNKQMAYDHSRWGTVTQYYFLPVHGHVWRVEGC